MSAYVVGGKWKYVILSLIFEWGLEGEEVVGLETVEDADLCQLYGVR